MTETFDEKDRSFIRAASNVIRDAIKPIAQKKMRSLRAIASLKENVTGMGVESQNKLLEVEATVAKGIDNEFANAVEGIKKSALDQFASQGVGTYVEKLARTYWDAVRHSSGEDIGNFDISAAIKMLREHGIVDPDEGQPN